MGNFCANCGAATGGGKFCPKCGAVQSGAAAPQAAYAAAPAAPAKSGSSALKIVFIILAVFIFIGLAGAVGAYYFVKSKVQEIVHSSGAQEWRDAVASAGRAQPTHAGCELLSKEKVAEILDTRVQRADGNDAGDVKEFCNYWAAGQTAEAPKKSDDEEKRDTASKDGPASMKDFEELAKQVSAASAAAGTGALLRIEVYRGTAKVALMGLKTASLFTGKKEQSVEGPWDEAYFGPFDALLFIRKGDNGVMLDLHKVSQPREKGLELAKAAAGGI